MKIDFFYTWTKNPDSPNEFMKSFSGGFSLPNFCKFLLALIPRSKKS